MVFLFIFYKNFVPKTKAKFGDKENATVVKITSTWSLDIRWSYKLVKGRRHRGVQFNWGSEYAVNYPTQWVQGEALLEAQRVEPLKALTISFVKPPTSRKSVSTFLSKTLLD